MAKVTETTMVGACLAVVPGFGLMAGLGALAIAAVAANQRTEQE